MAKWVLILVMDYHGTAIQKIDGFTSKETCTYAADQVDIEGYSRLYKFCIEVK